MSVERRLREGFTRNAETLDPSVEHRLDAVLGRHRVRARVRWAASALAVAAAIGAVVVFGPRLFGDLVGTPDPAEPPDITVVTLSGVFETTVDDDPTEHGLDGTWTMTLSRDGTLTLEATASYAGASLGTTFFEITEGRFRTTAFMTDVCADLGLGMYDVALAGTALTFTPDDDPCDGRVAVLASSSWTKID